MTTVTYKWYLVFGLKQKYVKKCQAKNIKLMVSTFGYSLGNQANFFVFDQIFPKTWKDKNT